MSHHYDLSTYQGNEQRSQHNACLGKVAYLDWDHAKKIAKKIRRNRSARAMVYRCRFCRGIHVGNNPISNEDKKSFRTSSSKGRKDS